MAQITAFGYVTEDLIPKQSQTKQPYVSFHLKERIGTGRWQIFQVWIWGNDVARITRLGINKGSIVWISGTLEIVDCTSNQGKEKAKVLKVYCKDFGFLPSKKQFGQIAAQEAGSYSPDRIPVPQEIDGDRMALPE